MQRFVVVASLLLSQLEVEGATCAQDGTDYSYAESVSGNTRTIKTNHCPNHPYYNLNPNVAVKEETTYTLPTYPVFVGNSDDSTTSSANIDLSAKGGVVGVFFNAAMLFSPYGGPSYGQVTTWTKSATYAEGNTFDQCGCHGSQTDQPSYHCHVPPSCLLQQLNQSETAHSPQIGWAFDGFPTYGPRGPNGVMMQTCTQTGGTYGTHVCTDDCGGYYLADGTIDNYKYRYYVLGQYNDGTSCDLPGCSSPTSAYYPNTPVCFRGCCPSGVSCHSSIPACPSSSISDGYTSSLASSIPTAPELGTNTGGCACGSLACSSSTCSTQGWSKTTCGAGSGWSNDCTTTADASGARKSRQLTLPAAGVFAMAVAVFAHNSI